LGGVGRMGGGGRDFVGRLSEIRIRNQSGQHKVIDELTA